MPAISTHPLSLTVSCRPWLATGVAEASSLAPGLEPHADASSAPNTIAIEPWRCLRITSPLADLPISHRGSYARQVAPMVRNVQVGRHGGPDRRLVPSSWT